MKRLGIYFIYDKDGIADDYIPYFLERLQPFCREICVVVNGRLTEESKKKILPFCSRILERENRGLDVMAYKYALDFYGREQIAAFDEVLLCNFTFFGPFYSMKPLFEKMSSVSCDLWGLFRWPLYNENGAFIRPLASFFVAYRRSVLQSNAFWEYWRTLPPIASYNDSVTLHEQRQAAYYEDKGFKVAAYVDCDRYKPYWPYHWPLFCARDLIEKEHFPFLKRRQFFIESGRFEWGQYNLDIIRFLRRKNLYDVSLIFNNISRTQPVDSLPEHHFSWKGLCFLFKSLFHYDSIRRERNKRKLVTRSAFYSAFGRAVPEKK